LIRARSPCEIPKAKARNSGDELSSESSALISIVVKIQRRIVNDPLTKNNHYQELLGFSGFFFSVDFLPKPVRRSTRPFRRFERLILLILVRHFLSAAELVPLRTLPVLTLPWPELSWVLPTRYSGLLLVMARAIWVQSHGTLAPP